MIDNAYSPEVFISLVRLRGLENAFLQHLLLLKAMWLQIPKDPQGELDIIDRIVELLGVYFPLQPSYYWKIQPVFVSLYRGDEQQEPVGKMRFEQFVWHATSV